MRSEIYFDERQIRKRRRILKLKIYSGIVAFFILVAGAAYLIIYSPLFRIKNISVTQLNAAELEERQIPYGAGEKIDPENVIQDLKNVLVKQSKFAGLLGFDNILVWKNGNFEEIFKLYPQIAELTIEKDYFERQIGIIIRERQRKGIWCVNDSSDALKCYWFDKNGVLFEDAPSIEGNLINKVNDFSGRNLEIGAPVLAEKLFSNLIEIFDVLEKSDLNVKSLKLERIELQEVVSESSPKIYFSLRIDPSFGLSALESIKNIGLEKIQYIDLRVENRAYYKIK